MRFNRKSGISFMSSYFFKIDYWLWGSVVVLCAVGLVAIASAAPQLVLPQTAWIIMGAIVAFACCLIDFRPLTHHRALALALLTLGVFRAIRSSE